MNRFVFLLFMLLTIQSYSQDYVYSKVAIDMRHIRVQDLLAMDIGLDHYHLDKHELIAEISERDVQLLKKQGVAYRELIKDVSAFYVQRNSSASMAQKTTSVDCSSNALNVLDKYTTPSQFTLGSMGGYFTYAEFLAHLDNMSTLYPNLITVKQPIDTFLTHENRPIYWLKISDNPSVEEAEPEVFYSSIHHAREPASLSQTIFFMYYLLENYNTDSVVKALVDSTEMYFVPMINPDGYIFNQTTNPMGGGMWRKNRRVHGAGLYGVDLNRNYGYGWGGLGASSQQSSDTYRGDSAFSEPETQAIKYFTETHDFKFALNYHTFSDLLLYPFGYDYNQPTLDDAYFKAFTPIMVSENGYANIISSELYAASGDSDDWMYADAGHDKVFAMTPEIGGDQDGFWPASSEILRLCKENVLANLTLAALTHDYALFKDQSPAIVNQTSFYMPFEILCLGLDTPSVFDITITPLSSVITSPVFAKTFSAMDLMERRVDSMMVSLASNIVSGQAFSFLVSIDNGMYTMTDTVHKTYLNLVNTAYDSCDDMNDWISPTWSTTNQTYVSASSSITDSPLSNYQASSQTRITYYTDIDLTNVQAAYASFYAKWEIEDNYDYAQFEASTDGGFTWLPLCGLYTDLGEVNQDFNQPLYDGASGWIKEWVNLEDLLGESVKLRFELVTDPFLEKDGFYFDDFQLFTESSSLGIKSPSKGIISVYPNPSNESFTIKGLPDGKYELVVTNLLGEVVVKNELQQTSSLIQINNLIGGLYFIQCKDEQGQIYTSSLVVGK